jgi:hypothetical protein
MSAPFLAALATTGLLFVTALLVGLVVFYRGREARRYRRQMTGSGFRPLGGLTYTALHGKVRAQLTPADYPMNVSHSGIGMWIIAISPPPAALVGCEKLLARPSLPVAPDRDQPPSSVATRTGHGDFDAKFHCVQPADVNLDQAACEALLEFNAQYPLVSLSSWEDSIELRLKRFSLSAKEGAAVLRAACNLVAAVEPIPRSQTA